MLDTKLTMRMDCSMRGKVRVVGLKGKGKLLEMTAEENFKGEERHPQ